MVNEEEKDLDKEEGSKREDHLLSPADWIMFLGGEMSYHRMRLSAYESAIVVCMLAALSGAIALTISGTTEFTIIITKSTIIVIVLGIFVICLLILLGQRKSSVKREIRDIEEIRKDIIDEKLKNHDEILKQCEERGVFKQKKN